MIFSCRLFIYLSFSYITAHGYQCNSKQQGPFLQLAELNNALFDQWMGIHGNIYAALNWTISTNGTVILPRNAKTRESFKRKLINMVPIPLGELIDIEFMKDFFTQKGLRIVYPSDDWSDYEGKMKKIYLPVTSHSKRSGYNSEQILSEAKQLGLDFNDPNTIFMSPSNFGGVVIEFNVTDYFNADLTMSRDVALSLRFSSNIRALAGKVINSLRKHAKGRLIIAIHLGLEADLDITSSKEVTRHLDEYRILIEDYSRDALRDFVLYVAYEELSSDIHNVVETWLKNYEHISKHSFLNQNDLKYICLECQAAIDAIVLIEVNDFIGFAYSSFSYIVSEIRNYVGLPFEMTRKPGFPIFYPLYSPRKNNWSTRKSISSSKLYPHIAGQKKFSRIARRNIIDGQPTDKVTAHRYQIMYGIFLVPMAEIFKQNGNRKLRILEIGMGCDMFYGPGKSLNVWKRLFGKAGEIWEADYNATCVDSAIKNNQLLGVNSLVGDQSDRNVLKNWIKRSNGNFDIIIDDGGHTNQMIYNTFDVLFNNALAPGGLYFIEDMHVGRLYAPYNGIIMSDLIQAWIEQLIVPNAFVNSDTRSKHLRVKYPIPPTIKWIFCQAEACVIAKCESLEHKAKCKPDYF